MTYDDVQNLARCARLRGQQAAADGDRGRYWRETAAANRLVGFHQTAITFDRMAEVVG